MDWDMDRDFFIEKIRLDSGLISAQTKPDIEAAVGLTMYIISQA